MYSAFPGNWRVSDLFFVYGRSPWAELNGGKILFTGRQTCLLYLVLWLCGCNKPNFFCWSWAAFDMGERPLLDCLGGQRRQKVFEDSWKSEQKAFYWTVQWCVKVKQNGWLSGCFKALASYHTSVLREGGWGTMQHCVHTSQYGAYAASSLLLYLHKVPPSEIL